MSGQHSNQTSQSTPGTLSPVTATLMSLFGTGVESGGGQYTQVPYQQFGQGQGAFSPQSFAALPGLLQNQPLTGVESAILGAQGGGFGGGIQGMGLQNALTSQDLLNRTAGALTIEPEAAIAQARRGFTQDTLPAILERAPGFSSSDLQREMTRAGVDLETNIGALRDAHQLALAQTVPQLAQSVGTNLLDQASQVLGFGQLGRELVRETGPAGDAFRVLTALQSLTTPALTQLSTGDAKSKGGGFW